MLLLSRIQLNSVPYAFLIAISKIIPAIYSIFIFLAPLEPKNLRTIHELTNQHTYYNIIVEWDVPTFLPDEYNVSLYFEHSPEVWQNVSGVCFVCPLPVAQFK